MKNWLTNMKERTACSVQDMLTFGEDKPEWRALSADGSIHDVSQGIN